MDDVVTLVLDVLAGACLLAGSALSLAAGLGALRFPDLLARMHAVTKPQVLGLLLVLLGLALRLRGGPAIWMLLLVALFQMLTSPVAAHMVARAGYRTGKVRDDLLVVDELTRDLDEAREEVRHHEAERAARRGAADTETHPDDPRPAGAERGRGLTGTDTGPAEPLS